MRLGSKVLLSLAMVFINAKGTTKYNKPVILSDTRTNGLGDLASNYSFINNKNIIGNINNKTHKGSKCILTKPISA